VVHEIRAIDPGLPAIVVTAYTGDDDLASARAEGLLAIFPKPVPVARLVQLLGQARRNGLVAIVEDDLALCDNLSENLRDCGFSAVTAATVTETDRMGAVAPFAALVDLKIPGGSAGEGMRRLATKYPGLPLIVITAHEQETPPVAPAGMFFKPFDTKKLLEALEKLYSPARAA
jgi:CheY-like chemotaxis protein